MNLQALAGLTHVFLKGATARFGNSLKPFLNTICGLEVGLSKADGSQ